MVIEMRTSISRHPLTLVFGHIRSFVDLTKSSAHLPCAATRGLRLHLRGYLSDLMRLTTAKE